MRSFKAIGVGLVFLVSLSLRASYIVQPAPASPVFPSTGTPVFVQAVEAHTAATPTSLSVNMGTQPVVSNIIVVGVTTLGASAASPLVTITDNQSNGYSRLSIFPVNTGLVHHVTLWCQVIKSSSGTYTITATIPTNDGIGIFALEYSATTCNPDQNQFGASGATSPYSCGSFTSTNAKDLVLAFISAPSATGTTTFTAPTGFTERINQPTAASGIVASISDDIVSATATFTPTYGTGQNHASTPCSTLALLSK